MTRAKRIVVVGVAGFNRGDDAITQSLIDALRARFTGAELTVTVLRPTVVRSGSAREIVINRKTLRSHAQLLHAIATSSFVVIGGGSIIQDEFGGTLGRGIMALYAEVAVLCRVFGRPMFTAPIGVDELHTRLGRRVARFILGACALVVTRDALSKARAEALLGAHAAVLLSADPAFSFERSPLPHATAPSFEPPTAPLLVVAPAFEASSRTDLAALLAASILPFLRRFPEGRCTIVAMDERPAEDAGHASAVIALLPPELHARVQIVIPCSADAACEVLDCASVLIAMRLHAMILAAGRVPTLCLSRGVKTDSIAQELAVPSVDLRRASATDVARAAQELTHSFTRVDAQLARTRARVSEQQGRFATYLDALTLATQHA